MQAKSLTTVPKHMWELHFLKQWDANRRNKIDYSVEMSEFISDLLDNITPPFSKLAVINSFVDFGFTVNTNVPPRRDGPYNVDIVFIYSDNESMMTRYLLTHTLSKKVRLVQIR